MSLILLHLDPALVIASLSAAHDVSTLAASDAESSECEQREDELRQGSQGTSTTRGPGVINHQTSTAVRSATKR